MKKGKYIPMGEKNKFGTKQGMSTKYEQSLIDEILKLYEDGYSVLSLCSALEISSETYYRWQRIHPEFAEKLNAIDSKRKENRFNKAMSALESRLEWREVSEIETVYEQIDKKGDKNIDNNNMKIKRMITRKKIVPPSDMLIAHTLVNCDPLKKWKSTNIASIQEQDTEEKKVTINFQTFNQ